MKFRLSYLLLVAAIVGVNGQIDDDVIDDDASRGTLAPAPVLIMVPFDTPAPVTLSPVMPPVMMTSSAPVASPTTPAPTPADTSSVQIANATTVPAQIANATTVPTPIANATTAPTGAPSTFMLVPTGANSTSMPIPTATPTISSYPTAYSLIDYFEEPEQKWTVQLPATGNSFGSKLGKGNAVTASPDGASVYVTMSDGRLEVLSAFDGGVRFSYKPMPAAEGWTVMCKSGVSFSETQGKKYAIFAVVDVPPTGLDDYQSRIIAVAHPGNKVMWISDTIPGEIQGRPLITESEQFPGEYIAFTHNQNVTSAPYGSFSLVRSETGALIYTEDAGESLEDPDPLVLERLTSLRLPYAPLAVAHEPAFGRYPAGEGNGNDLFIWSTSDGEGRGPDGYTRAFQLPRVFEPEFAEMLFTSFLKENRWNAIAEPVMSQDGLNLIFGTRANRIRGWTGMPDYNELANVVPNLEEDPEDPRNPIPYAPILSTGETRLFVVTSIPMLYALDAETGEIQWNVTGEADASASVKVSSDDTFVYLTWEDGKVMALRQVDGTVVWSIDCMSIVDGPETTCADVIEAESSVSPNGLVFYYGDATGNVKALQIGNSTEATPVPTGFPTRKPTESPTAAPTTPPTKSPAPSPGPSVSMMPSGVNDTAVPTSEPTFSTDSPSVSRTGAPVTPRPTKAPATMPQPTPAPFVVAPVPTADTSSSTRVAMASFAVVLTSLLFFVF